MRNAKPIANYARALFELAQEEGKVAEFAQQLKKFSATMTPELLTLMVDPVFHAQEKEAVMVEVSKRMQLPSSLNAFVLLLVRNGRLAWHHEILNAFQALVYAAENRQLVTLRCAAALNSSERQQLEKLCDELVKKTNHRATAQINEEVDPNLLGGMVVQIGSKLYDGSVRGRLKQLQAKLL